MKYNRDKNYCSYSPEELFGVRYNYACFCHDRHYRNEIINRKTRKQSDIMLRDMIYRAFDVANKRFRGFIISRIYYFLVRIFGGKYYEV